MRVPRCTQQMPLLLVWLLATTATSLAQTQQSSPLAASSSSSKRAPYACFFDECPSSKAAEGNSAVFEACLMEGAWLSVCASADTIYKIPSVDDALGTAHKDLSCLGCFSFMKIQFIFVRDTRGVSPFTG